MLTILTTPTHGLGAQQKRATHIDAMQRISRKRRQSGTTELSSPRLPHCQVIRPPTHANNLHHCTTDRRSPVNHNLAFSPARVRQQPTAANMESGPVGHRWRISSTVCSISSSTKRARTRTPHRRMPNRDWISPFAVLRHGGLRSAVRERRARQANANRRIRQSLLLPAGWCRVFAGLSRHDHVLMLAQVQAPSGAGSTRLLQALLGRLDHLGPEAADSREGRLEGVWQELSPSACSSDRERERSPGKTSLGNLTLSRLACGKRRSGTQACWNERRWFDAELDRRQWVLRTKTQGNSHAIMLTATEWY